jgi:glutaredoxin
VPINSQLAQDRFPVSLYTFACGELCRNAEGLLNRRGVPFTTVNVSSPGGAEKLQRLTGDLQAPVLQVGDKLIAKGYNENVWQELLNEAGYPKTPPPRRAQPARPPAEPASADAAKPASVKVTPGSGYPVN